MGDLFACPTLKDLDSKLKITENGRSDAKNGIPAEQSTDLSKNEEGIKDYLVKEIVNEARSKAQELLSQWHLKRIEMHVGESIDRIRVLPNRTEADLSAIETQDESDLVRDRFSMYCAEADMKLFRAQNELRRDATYPDSQIMHRVIIGAILLGETLMNGFFFSQGMERGLVGGMIAAFIITLVNVVAAFVVGTYCAPRANHIDRGSKIFGWLMFVVYGVLLIWFCVAVGHYRSLIQINEDALVAAVEIMKVIFDWELFSIKEFNGWILVFFSLLIGVITTIKFYKADDVYPGYGELDRKLKKSEKAFSKSKSSHSAKMNTFVQGQQEELFTLHRKTEGFVKESASSIKKSGQLIAEYEEFCKTVQSAYNGAIQLYRKSNGEVRVIDAPSYFAVREVIDDGQMRALDVSQYNMDLEEQPQIQDKIEELPSVYAHVRDDIERIRSSLEQRFTSFMERTDGQAKARFQPGNH